jgi:hypothetical protein
MGWDGRGDGERMWCVIVMRGLQVGAARGDNGGSYCSSRLYDCEDNQQPSAIVKPREIRKEESKMRLDVTRWQRHRELVKPTSLDVQWEIRLIHFFVKHPRTSGRVWKDVRWRKERKKNVIQIESKPFYGREKKLEGDAKN